MYFLTKMIRCLSFFAAYIVVLIPLADVMAMDEADHSSHSRGHSQHLKATSSNNGYQRTVVRYSIPDFNLIRSDGSITTLYKELDHNEPVMLNFVFTSCTTICPVMSTIFSRVQKKLGKSQSPVRMISISIDPEQDTPKILHHYEKTYSSGNNWQFLTGDLSTIIELQKAFGAYRGNKMNHIPATYMKTGKGEEWVKLDGFANADDIVREYHRL